MRYLQNDINYEVKPQEFNKDSEKEILQYAVGGLLYMPASKTDIADKIISGKYEFVKSLVLDLEDSLGDDLVGFGQRAIVSIIKKFDSAVNDSSVDFSYDDVPLIFIRVRSHGQMHDALNMLGDNIKYITGFNVPKFSKDNCDDYIAEFTEVMTDVKNRFNDQYKLYIMPIIEDKLAMYRQTRMENLLYMNNVLRPLVDYVLNIRVGGADFCSTFGIRRGIRDTIYDVGPVRSVLNDIVNVFGKSYIVSGAVWEYFENKDRVEDTRWKDGLVQELYKDRLHGFLGKTSIHPSQLRVIQKSLIVDKNDYLDALSILGINENAVGVKKSVEGNRMNEVKTHRHWARKTIGLASVYGVK